MPLWQSNTAKMSANVANIIRRHRQEMSREMGQFWGVLRGMKNSARALDKNAETYIKDVKDRKEAYSKLCAYISDETDKTSKHSDKIEELCGKEPV